MTLAELAAKISAPVKNLSDARTLLAEAAAAVAASEARLVELDAHRVTDQATIAELQGKVDTSATALAASVVQVEEISAQLATVQSGTLEALASAGIKCEKLDPALIKAATLGRAESISHELLAARGMKPLAEIITAAGEVEAPLTTPAQIVAAYEAMPAGPERTAFLARHEQAIWSHYTGR